VAVTPVDRAEIEIQSVDRAVLVAMAGLRRFARRAVLCVLSAQGFRSPIR
jgi:hypothetical protein